MKTRVLLALKLIVTGLLLWWLFRSFPMGQVFSRTRGMSIPWFMGAFGISLLVWIMQSVRWQRMTLEVNGEVPKLREFLYYTAIGYFFNILLPSGMGGDAVKSVGLGRAMKDLGGSLASVFMSRVMGMAVMIACFWIAMFLWQGTLPTPVITGMIGISVATGLGLILFFGPWKLAFLLKTRLRRFIEFRAFLKIGGRGWLDSLAIQILVTFQPWMFFRSIGVHMPLVPVFLFLPPITLLTMIPVSVFGLGVREWATVYLFTLTGFTAADCLASQGPAYLLVLLQALLGGLWFAWRTIRAR